MHHSGMATLEIRRERTLGGLRGAYARGALSTRTFEARVDAALMAASIPALTCVTWDVAPWMARLELFVARTRHLLAGLLGRRGSLGAMAVYIDLAAPARQKRGTWTIGRSSGCDIVIWNSPTVSRVHAELSLRDGVWYLRDCGSRNGTWVGRHRVRTICLDPRLPLRLGELEIRWLLD